MKYYEIKIERLTKDQSPVYTDLMCYERAIANVDVICELFGLEKSDVTVQHIGENEPPIEPTEPKTRSTTF